MKAKDDKENLSSRNISCESVDYGCDISMKTETHNDPIVNKGKATPIKNQRT